MNTSRVRLPHLYTLADVAEATHQGYQTVWRHAAEGRLKTVRPGGGARRLVTEADFERYLFGDSNPAEDGEPR